MSPCGPPPQGCWVHFSPDQHLPVWRQAHAESTWGLCRLSDEEYSDDEDVSWKVRRAAAKCLQAIIESYPDLLKDIYPKSATALIGRFREREENVKSDIFQTFVDLVKQIGATAERFEGAAAPRPIDQLRSELLGCFTCIGAVICVAETKQWHHGFCICTCVCAALQPIIL